MNPPRVAELLGISGGGGGSAGALDQLISLNDPGDDRILFWDDSAALGTEIKWLDIGTHLEITAGGVLNVVETGITHDNLTGFVANEHIDHTAVTITAGVGLSYSVNGADISADSTIDLDINALTTETTLDFGLDFLPFYDASAATERKTTLQNLLGDVLGDGKFYRSTDQALSAATEATVAYNATEYNQLQRGTFSTITGEYTAGAEATRLLVSAGITIQAMNDDDSMTLSVEVGGVEKLRTRIYNDTDNDSPEQTITVCGTVEVAAAAVVRVRMETSSAETIDAGTSRSFVSIIELA
jgi:hypothetical protein